MFGTAGEHAVERCVQWALSLWNDGEGFRGAEGEILSLYKAPIALLAAGRASAAAAVVHLLKQRHFRDGDFHAHPAGADAAPGRSYRNAWLAWGAHELGAYELSQPALDRLERGLHSRHHGSPDNDAAAIGQRIYPAGGTAKVANALLAGGRLASAAAAGRFLQALFDEQPADATRILLVRGESGALLDPASTALPGAVESYVFDLAQPHQTCWIFGLTLRVYARLFRASGDKSWLRSAEHLHSWILRADPSLYATVTNGKLAWGAAEMFGVTGDGKWLELARRTGEWMLSQQDSQGIWVRRPPFSAASDQSAAVSLDTSLERAFYLVDIPRALSLAPRA